MGPVVAYLSQSVIKSIPIDVDTSRCYDMLTTVFTISPSTALESIRIDSRNSGLWIVAILANGC